MAIIPYQIKIQLTFSYQNVIIKNKKKKRSNGTHSYICMKKYLASEKCSIVDWWFSFL